MRVRVRFTRNAHIGVNPIRSSISSRISSMSLLYLDAVVTGRIADKRDACADLVEEC